MKKNRPTREERYREKQRQKAFEGPVSKTMQEQYEEQMRQMYEMQEREARRVYNFSEMTVTLDGQRIPVERVQWTSRAPDPQDRFRYEMEQLTRERDTAKQEAATYEQALKQLQETACALGIVGDVKDKRVTIRIGPLVVDAALPKDGCKVGDFVRIVQPSNQILDVTDAPRVGATGTVEHVEPGFCEVSVNGAKRRLVIAHKCGDLKVGDQVVVDDSGYMAMTKASDGVESQVFEETTNVSWADIGGLEDAKEALREAIEYPLQHAALYHKYGKTPSKGVLLYGPAGCGKTMVGKATATAISKAHGSKVRGGFLYVKGPELLDKYVGATEEAIRQLFARARRYKSETGHAAVMFIDEADAILGRRGGRSLGGMEATVVPAFLAEMDGLTDTGAFVMLSTNRPDALDAAIVRDGRIDRKIKVSRPDRISARSVLGLHLRHHPLAEDIEELGEVALSVMFSDDAIVREIGEFESRKLVLYLRDVLSGAVIAGAVNRATERAIRRDRDAHRKNPSGLTADDLRNGVLASARELADTDLVHDMMDVVIREVGHEALEKFGHKKAPRAEEMN